MSLRRTLDSRKDKGTETMDGKLQALDLARIVEDFFVELQNERFIGPCDCCGFPVPAPFIDPDTDELLCRNCRVNHNENGEHIGDHQHH